MSAAGRDARRLPEAVRAAAAGQRVPNPRHMPLPVYLARARAAPSRGARRNGGRALARAGQLPGRHVRAHARRGAARPEPRARAGRGRSAQRIPVRRPGRGGDQPGRGRAAGHARPRHGRRLRRPAGLPDGQADATRRGARRSIGWRPARAGTGIALSVTSAFRSDAEQARLFAANPNPKWVAPPGHQPAPLGHRARPGPAGRVRVAEGQRRRFGFIHRYAWEPWHYGFGRTPATASTRPSTRRAPGSRRVATTAGSSTACPASCRRASTTRSPRRRCAGTCR